MPINFKISAYIQHQVPVTWPSFGENRSKNKVTVPHDVYIWNVP